VKIKEIFAELYENIVIPILGMFMWIGSVYFVVYLIYVTTKQFGIIAALALCMLMVLAPIFIVKCDKVAVAVNNAITKTKKTNVIYARFQRRI
jgi:hypothetical protein